MSQTQPTPNTELQAKRETVVMVRYATWIAADFGGEVITTVAGPFADEETAQYWIDHNEDEYVTNFARFPDPTIQHHPIRTIDDLR